MQFSVIPQETKQIEESWRFAKSICQRKIYLGYAKCDFIFLQIGGARGVMIIVAVCGHDDTSSSPGRAWLHFT